MSSAADGKMAAAQALSKTVLRPEIRRVLDTYRRLESDEAKAQYADHFLSRTAGVMEDVWPAFYELLSLIKDRELYRRPDCMTDTCDSFAEYFEKRAGRPFTTWSELESTYHYARDCGPELFRKTFTDALAIAERTTQRAAELDGKTINSGAGPLTQGERSNLDNVKITSGHADGNSADYLTRRIARDYPEILARMKAGEFRSVRAAALEAGIVHRTVTVRFDDPESAARTLRKMPPDDRRALAKLLLDGLPDGQGGGTA